MPPKYVLMSRKMQNINTFWKTGGRMKIYTYQGRKNVSGEKNTSDEKYKTDVTVRSGGKNAGGRCDAGT